jgi:ribosomal protein S18 acetylase RimI-like enzyme
MILFLALGGLITAAGAAAACWKNVFRRRDVDLTDADLMPEDPSITKNTKMTVVRKLTSVDRAALKQAFAESPEFVWIYSGKSNVQLLDPTALKKLEEQNSYMMEFVILLAESYGHIIKCVDNESGTYQGSICLIPPVSSSLYMAYMLKTMLGVGKPPSAITEDAVRNARFKSFGQTIEQHHDVMKDAHKHWYVLVLGVGVSAQGKRVGTRLLQQAAYLAGDLPVFLECHDGNVAFYQKNGYELKKRYMFGPAYSKDVKCSASDEAQFPFDAMVYQKNQS